MNQIEIEDLTKTYRMGRRGSGMPLPQILPRRRAKRNAKKASGKEVMALRGISLNVKKGTTLGVIGPNGAGKTSLLKILARVSPPTSGRAVIRGRTVPLLELGGGLQADSTVRENVYLSAMLYGIPRSVATARMDDIMSFADLEEFTDLPVTRLSSGMALRLTFSLAVNLDPDVLLADEILAVGDLVFQERCLRKVEDASAEGLTVLFVSHDMTAVRRLCDEVVWLHNGEVMARGPTDEVVSRYEEAAWSVLAQDADDSSAKSRHGQILGARLVSPAGTELGSVKTSDEFFVEVAVRTEAAGTLIRCVLGFYVEGVAAFRSVQPEAFLARKPGVYSARVAVPAFLLSDTVYSVKAGVALATPKRDLGTLVSRNAVSFRVVEESSQALTWLSPKGAVPGVVRPRLQWEMARSEKPSRAGGGARRVDAGKSRSNPPSKSLRTSDRQPAGARSKRER